MVEIGFIFSLRNDATYAHKKDRLVAIEVVALRAHGGIGVSLIVDHTFVACSPAGEGLWRIRVAALGSHYVKRDGKTLGGCGHDLR